MKNQALVCVPVLCLLAGACTPRSSPPTAENIPTAAAVVVAQAPLVPGPTNTTIPLPTSPIQVPTLGTAILPGLSGPVAAPNQTALNCRAGPDLAWPVVTVLAPGQAVAIVGRNMDGTWWYVRHPSLSGSFCWISAGFTTTTGNATGVPVVAVSPAPAIYNTPEPVIISIDMGVDPNVIQVAGCVGPIQPVTVWAKIQTDGALKVKMNFEDEMTGHLRGHTLFFTSADIQDVSDTFTPRVIEGRHRVNLIIDDYVYTFATYVIDC